MTKTKKVGPAASFGAKYGTVVRKRYAEIITQMHQPYECPKCGFKRVSRVSVGVWTCQKCGLKFAGGAYVPFTKLGEISRRVAKGSSVQAEIEVKMKAEAEGPKRKERKERKRGAKVAKEEVL
jgi:large subunit ribosomal protein L37Ae